MAAQTPPYAQQNGSHTAALFRQAFASTFGVAQPGTLGSSAGGVTNTTDLAVTAQASPNMTVNVAGGTCWIPQTSAANGGLYFGLNDATVVVTIAAANATNPRVDLICATVNDAAYSGSTNNWVIQAITGTPTAGATLTNLNGAGALPSSSIPLGYVLVPAAATTVTSANISDVRTFTTTPNSLRGNPAGRMVSTGAQSAAASYAQIGSFSAQYLKGGMTSTATTMTVPEAGVYSIKAGTSLHNGSSAAPPTAFYSINVYKNGTNFLQAAFQFNSPAQPYPTIAIASDRLLAANDYLQVYFSCSGTAYSSNVAINPSFLDVALVSQ